MEYKFEWLTDKQWEKYIDMIQEIIYNSYGRGLFSRIKYGEFLRKNS